MAAFRGKQVILKLQDHKENGRESTKVHHHICIIEIDENPLNFISSANNSNIQSFINDLNFVISESFSKSESFANDFNIVIFENVSNWIIRNFHSNQKLNCRYFNFCC